MAPLGSAPTVTLSYHVMVEITTVKSFILQAAEERASVPFSMMAYLLRSEVKTIKTFTSVMEGTLAQR